MKICITAQGDSLDAQVDPRFGRCQYFLIADSETQKLLESIPNQNVAAASGAGIQSAQLVANKEVKVVLTGNVGPNAFQTLQAAGVKVITGVSGSVREAIFRFNKGEFKETQGPTVASKFGMGAGQQIQAPPSAPGQAQGPGYGAGMGYGMGWQQPMFGWQGPVPGMYSPPQMTRQQELQMLKNQVEFLRQQMELIKKRIDELSED